MFVPQLRHVRAAGGGVEGAACATSSGVPSAGALGSTYARRIFGRSWGGVGREYSITCFVGVDEADVRPGVAVGSGAPRIEGLGSRPNTASVVTLSASASFSSVVVVVEVSTPRSIFEI